MLHGRHYCTIYDIVAIILVLITFCGASGVGELFAEDKKRLNRRLLALNSTQ